MIAIYIYILKGSNDANKMVKTLNNSSLNFKYSTLEKATGSFAEANKLGQGGFGTVYKASLHFFASKQAINITHQLTKMKVLPSVVLLYILIDVGSSVGRKRDSCEEAFLQ